MIWQENVSLIVMLTREKERGKDGVVYAKADRYWDDKRLTLMTHGRIGVELADVVYITDDNHVTTHNADAPIILRRFSVSCDGDRRSVHHLQYVGWPDFGAPKEFASYRALLQRYRELRRVDEPVLVHCSAGIGRTGTFCLIDIVTDYFAAHSDGAVDVCALVSSLRRQRPMMVQSRDQLHFAYEFIADALRTHSLTATPTAATNSG